MPSSTCTVLIEKWVRFKLTEFKNFWRTIPDVENSSFVMTDNPNFNILFSILPGLLQHPSLKMESTSNGLAEQAIMLLKSISTKYCSVILGWSNSHPQYPQISQFITSAFVSFSRAAYFFAVPLKNCIEATFSNVNVFHPSLDYTVYRALLMGQTDSHTFWQLMKGGLQSLKDNSCCSVEICSAVNLSKVR
jgi:hypothetical protein